jgi:YHS domain-containing protein
VICAAIAMLAVGMIGCQQAQQQQAEKAQTETQSAMPESTAAGSDTMAMDPTCGMQVPMSTQWTAQYEGKTYYFCSQQCRDQFMADPSKYLEPEATKDMKGGM